MTSAITAISPEAGKKNRLLVLVDGEIWLSVHQATARALHLAPGIIDDPAALEEEILRRERINGFEQLAKFLRLRPRSEKEIKLRLSRYGYDGRVIDSMVEEMRKSGLVEDSRFARLWVTEGVRVGKGRMRLRQELLNKGVPAETIDTALQNVYPEQEDFSRALELARRRFARTKEADREIVGHRIVGFIQRRGFSLSTAKQVWHHLTAEDRT